MNLSPLPIQKFFDNNGRPLVGGLLFTYESGTTTKLATYSDEAGTPNTNPIVLDYRGECSVWLDITKTYKFVLSPSNDTDPPTKPIWSVDNIAGAITILDLTQQFIGQIIWPQTADEITAGSVPTNYGYPPYNINRYGALPSASAATNTTAIQAAISAATISGELVTSSVSGVYDVNASQAIALESGTEYTAFVMASNLHIDMPGVTVRMANGNSTRASPKAINLFATNQVLQNVSFRNVVLDMNGDNNLISPLPVPPYNSGVNMAHISVSGTPGGVAARIDDCVIDNCWFINTSGVCCIVAGQTNSVGKVLGNRWTIKNNLFYNNGLDSIDHTSIFGWVNNCLVDGNYFFSAAALILTSLGGITCHEIHGSNHRVVNNVFENYYRGVFVAGNFTSPALNSIIANNVFLSRYFGVQFFREGATDQGNAQTKIHDNIFVFDNSDNSPPAPDQKSAIVIGTTYVVTDIDISDNYLYSTDDAVGTVFVTVTASATAAQVFDNIRITRNIQRGGSFGCFVTTNATNGLGYLEITDNTWINLSDTPGFTTPMGIRISANQPVAILKLAGNNCIDMRGGSAECDYGIFLQANFTNLIRGRNFAFGMVTASYDENSIAVTNRFGDYSLATVASAAALTLSTEVDTFFISGTTNITSISAAGHAGHTVTLIFQGILTFTDGSNLILAGNFVTTADDTITLWCDGTNWYEKARSVN